MNIKSAKAKGRRCAAEVKKLLIKFSDILNEGDIVVTPSSVPGPDLHLSPFALRIFPFVIECKNQEKMNIWASLEQCLSHKSSLNQIPVLFFKRNKSDLYVALLAEDFMKNFKPYEKV